MYETRWATATDLPLLIDYWRRMVCEMGADDDIHAPTAGRVAEVGRLFAPEMAAGQLAFRLAVDEGGTVIACTGGLLRTEYPFPLSPEPVPFGWVISVYTLPEHRGCGLASQLVSAVCAWLKERGADRARLWASTKGRPVYARLGFHPMFDMVKEL